MKEDKQDVLGDLLDAMVMLKRASEKLPRTGAFSDVKTHLNIICRDIDYQGEQIEQLLIERAKQ